MERGNRPWHKRSPRHGSRDVTEAKASEYVTYEWSFAVGAEIPVIPILYKQPTLHPRLSRYQYLNFLNPSVRPWDQLLGEIKEINKLRARMRLDSTTPAYIRQAIGALDSANPTDRKGGIFILAEAADRNTIAKEALRGGINHPLFDVRALAAGKLVLIDPDATNDSLLKALDEGLTCGNEEIREVIQVGIW